jgi:hypothetical protein
VFWTESEESEDLKQDDSRDLLVDKNEMAKREIIDLFQPLAPSQSTPAIGHCGQACVYRTIFLCWDERDW